LGHVVREGIAEARLGIRERDAILGPLRAGDRRHDRREIKLDLLGVFRFGSRVVPQALRSGVGLDEGNLFGRPAGQLEVPHGLLIDREDRDGRAVLRAHVADRRPVGQRDSRHPGAVELHELPDHAVLPEHLGDGQHQVGGRGTFRHLAVELEADHLRDEHRDGLAQHRRLGLDAPDSPAEDAQPVDHRGVRIGADEGVGVGDPLAVEHDAGEVLDVDLVHDAGARRHDLEIVERRLPPAQELVALGVALVLQLDVALERVRRAEEVGDDGVVDDQLGGSEGVDLRRVAAERLHGLAHGREVDDARNAGEVLHDDAGRRELDLRVRLGRGVPAR
jgi:hypothetical protein